MSIYTIKKEILNLINLVDEDGEPTMMEAEEVKDRIKNLEMDLDQKAENTIAYTKNLKAEEKMLEEEIKILTKRRDSKKKRRLGLMEFLKDTIILANRFFDFNGIHKAGMQNNSQPSVIVMDENEVPDEFIGIEIKVNKSAILKHYKETGEILPGVDIVHGQHLRIR